MAFVSSANALFLYICCILQYLYFVNSINYIFSITHFILWSRDLMVSADVVLSILPPRKTFRCRQTRPGAFSIFALGQVWWHLTHHIMSLTSVSVYRNQNVIHAPRAQLNFRVRFESQDLEVLDLGFIKTASRANCTRGLHALLQHIPSWPLERACDVMGSVWNLEHAVL